MRAPVIEPTSGGEGGGDLPHSKSNRHRQCTTDQPDQHSTPRTRSIKGGREGRNPTRQDTDDRERYCKVGEATHPASKLLGVSHLVQYLFIMFLNLVSHCIISFMKLKRFGMGKSVSLALCHRCSLRIGNGCNRVNHWDFLYTTHRVLKRDAESPENWNEEQAPSLR